jgi:hypothetical protein
MMKRKKVRIYTQESDLLWEAMRRILHLKTEGPRAWVGLGCPSEYKAGVKSGFFSIVGTIRPYGRNWYRLTPLGKRIVNQLIRKKLCPTHIHEIYQGAFNIRIPKYVTVYVPEV